MHGPAYWTDKGLFDGWDEKTFGKRVVDLSWSMHAKCARFEDGTLGCPSKLHGDSPNPNQGVAIPSRAPAPSLPSFSFTPYARVRGFAFEVEPDEARPPPGRAVCLGPFVAPSAREEPSPPASIEETTACPMLKGPGIVLGTAPQHELVALLDARSTFTTERQLGTKARHAFVFYDARDKPVAWVTVDLKCHAAWSYPPLPAALVSGDWNSSVMLQSPAVKRLAKLCASLGLPSCPKPESVPASSPCPVNVNH